MNTMCFLMKEKDRRPFTDCYLKKERRHEKTCRIGAVCGLLGEFWAALRPPTSRNQVHPRRSIIHGESNLLVISMAVP